LEESANFCYIDKSANLGIIIKIYVSSNSYRFLGYVALSLPQRIAGRKGESTTLVGNPP